MESLKNVYCEKMGLFRFLAEKNFFCGGACGWTRWTAARRGVGVRGVLARRGVGVRGVLARRGVGVRGVLARRSGRVWMDVPGRAWMDAMEVVHV